MMQRCRNKNDPSYALYGGRGITVCERWHKFENFFADMGHPPPGLWIERVNNSLGYMPSNCAWSTPAEQAANRRPPKRKHRHAKLEDITRYAASLTRAASGARAAS
jgi:hypothetical protein